MTALLDEVCAHQTDAENRTNCQTDHTIKEEHQNDPEDETDAQEADMVEHE